MQDPLAQALASGTLLLTATQRLPRWLRADYDRIQRAAGRAAWESPRITALGTWLREAWDDGVEAAPGPGGKAPQVLLSDAQAEAVWEQVLLADPAAGRVLHPRATAALAQDAWELMHQWAFPAFTGGESPDIAAFLRWSGAYREHCDRRGWTDTARLPGLIAAAIRAGRLETPPAVLLAGFDDLAPAHADVMQALRERGCAVETVPTPALGRHAVVAPWPDAEAEAEAAARWARHGLEQGAGGPIGIVVPDLAARRGSVERHLRAVLEPGTDVAREPGDGLFNISQGLPLAEAPLVRTALVLLQIARERLSLAVAGHLLRTPFLMDAERERTARGLLEARLREVGELEPTVGLLARLAAPGAEPRPWHAPGLAGVLARLQAARKGQPVRQPCGAWARTFDAWLSAAGWPGERPLNSAEHQAREKWQTLLENFASLERVLPPLTWGDAAARLTRLAGQTTFQPESPEAPVQVLGLLESGGLAFEHLWVMGMEDDAWPPPARPNPLLPLALQRKLGLPHANAAWELRNARHHTERLRQCAPDVVFSHAQRRGDEKLRASPLIGGGAQAGDISQSRVMSRVRQVQAAGTLAPWADHQAPPLPPDDEVRGGTSVFKDMAACPFRAFARHRLHAETLAEPVPGLGADRRGELAHRALEYLWRGLGDQAALAALTAESARALVQDTVKTAIGACEERWRRQLPAPVAALEQERLTVLLLELLELERIRQPFRVVEKEERRDVMVGGIALHVQIDRIDELADGKRLLLDYKTGRDTAVSAWFSDRPDEPQVPIYAVTSAQPVHGVGFVRVRHGDAGYVCITDGLEVPRKLPAATGRPPRPQPAFSGYVDKATGETFADRAAVLARWRATLEKLGAQFRAGVATVDPKNPAKTCTYCDLPALCRINPMVQWADGEGGEGDDDPA